MTFTKTCLCVLSLSLSTVLGENLTLNPLFTDHGVLQQELPVPIWGEGVAGATVVVTFAGQKVETKVGADGRWQTVLQPLKASAEAAQLIVKSGSEQVAVDDLLVGEVWVCSGQSNMAMTVSGSSTADETLAAAGKDAFPLVRLFKVPVDGADTRATTVPAVWTVSDATTVRYFSAAGFYFGAALQKARGVPVGLIQSANGGTNAFSWINSETYLNDEAAEPTRNYFKAALAAYPKSKERYDIAMEKWKAKAAAAKAAGEKFTDRAPRAPLGKDHVKRPTGHYNAMVAPLQPYAIRGAIWYQGEANSRPPFTQQYRDLMFALVEDWRGDWAEAGRASGVARRDFPFYLVQLPNYGGGHPQGWPNVREQMLKFWQDGKNTGMVTTIDVGETKDIHPRNKKAVGERLARFARANTYGEDIVYSGPIYSEMRVEENQVTLRFQHVGGGLVSTDDQPLRHFQVAGGDGNFVPATSVKIAGDAVVVSAESIAEPRAVRYAWISDPLKINFANKEGLPASPFRTDSWEIDFSAPPASAKPQAKSAPAASN